MTTVNLVNPFIARAPNPLTMMVGAYNFNEPTSNLTALLPSDIQEGDLLVYRQAASVGGINAPSVTAGWVNIATTAHCSMSYFIAGASAPPAPLSVLAQAGGSNVTRYRVPKAAPFLTHVSGVNTGPTLAASAAEINLSPSKNNVLLCGLVFHGANGVSYTNDFTVDTTFAAAGLAALSPDGTMSTANVEEDISTTRWRAEGLVGINRLSSRTTLRGFSLGGQSIGATGAFSCTLLGTAAETHMIVAAFEFA